MDFYLSSVNAINRLVWEWTRYKRLIIAYDFDNTVFDYHGEGHTYEEVARLLRECKLFGAHLVVFTASPEERYSDIESYLYDNDIPFDSINENPSWLNIPEGKKIYYNILLDDRAGLKSAVYQLKTALRIMKEKEK